MNISRVTNLRSVIAQKKVFITHRGLKAYNGVNLQLLKRYEGTDIKTRFASTCAVKDIQKDEGWIKTVFRKIPFLNINKTRIRASSYLLYEEIADHVNHLAFFEKFDLPDTFYSWFVVTELHIWMLSVRGMAEGEDGRHLRNFLVEALWADVAQRVKKLRTGNPAGMKDQISELSEQLQAALIAYDEGLQSTDMVLAGALWRRFYQSETANLNHLEKLVKYVRKQITLLDNMSRDQLFKEHSVCWEPLK